MYLDAMLKDICYIIIFIIIAIHQQFANKIFHITALILDMHVDVVLWNHIFIHHF